MKFGLVALLLSLSTACQQFGTAEPDALANERRQTFLALDANRDGFVSHAEAQGAPLVARDFERADANRDGALNRPEFNSVGEKQSR